MRQMADRWRTCATPVKVIAQDVTARLWEMYIYASKADCLDMGFHHIDTGNNLSTNTDGPRYMGVRRSHTNGLGLAALFGYECRIQEPQRSLINQRSSPV